MHRLWLSLAGGGGFRLPAAGAAAGRNAVIGAALAGGSVAYLRSYPKSVPPKEPGDRRLVVACCVLAWEGARAGRARMQRCGMSGGSCCAASAAALVAHGSNPPSCPRSCQTHQTHQKRLLLDRPLMEMVCGAVGEVAQVCVLYPLETLKVKCQAEGVAAAAALSAMLHAGPLGAARQLYAGVGAAALCSVVVGAVHYASFCVSKRAAVAAAAAEGGGKGGDANAGQQGAATAIAAVVGAVSTAAVEAPCDRFRHLAQAGLLNGGGGSGGNFLSAMVAAVRTGGLGSLYYGFTAFCLESLPYDVVELGAYGSLNDRRDAALARGDAFAKRLAALPPHAVDMAIGAASGAAAVIVSMPLDVIKTKLQTHGADAVARAGGGALGELAAFVATGRAMVAARGPGSLFIGLGPRLLQQVPSSTLCWVVIERCRALLEPYTRA